VGRTLTTLCGSSNRFSTGFGVYSACRCEFAGACGDDRRFGRSAGMNAPELTLPTLATYRWQVETGSTGAACSRPGSPFFIGREPLRGQAVPVVLLTGDVLRRATRCEHVPTTPLERAREQAYVPAEQPSPPQGARLPPADAHPCGSRDPVHPSSQGSQESRSLRPVAPDAVCEPPSEYCRGLPAGGSARATGGGSARGRTPGDLKCRQSDK
jgi:hypothetical protein